MVFVIVIGVLLAIFGVFLLIGGIISNRMVKNSGQSGESYAPVIITGTIAIIIAAVLIVSTLSNSDLMNKASAPTQTQTFSTCQICGGTMKCAVCGKSGMYCEKSSYGSGTDHFCGTHWADVVEWHKKH